LPSTATRLAARSRAISMSAQFAESLQALSTSPQRVAERGGASKHLPPHVRWHNGFVMVACVFYSLCSFHRYSWRPRVSASLSLLLTPLFLSISGTTARRFGTRPCWAPAVRRRGPRAGLAGAGPRPARSMPRPRPRARPTPSPRPETEFSAGRQKKLRRSRPLLRQSRPLLLRRSRPALHPPPPQHRRRRHRRRRQRSRATFAWRTSRWASGVSR